MKTLVAAFIALLVLAGTATAAPVIDRVETELRKERKLIVKVEATLDGAGEIRLTGTVNGVPYERRKKVRRASSKRAKFKVNAKKLGFRKLSGPLEFDLRVVAELTSGATTSLELRTRVALPLVLVPGLGNELDNSSVELFAASLELATLGTYEREGDRRNLHLHQYESLSTSLGLLGQELDDLVDDALAGTRFTKVDVVGYSMGGLVVRSWMATGGGAGKVRKVIFVGTPNEGTPIAYLPELLRGTAFFSEIPAGADDLVDLLLDSTAVAALSNFYPTYEWAFLGGLPVSGLLGALFPDSPLTALNAADPDPDAEYHALCYSEAGADLLGLSIGTVSEIDFLNMFSLTSGGLDPAQFDPEEDLEFGPGDGLVPLRSVFMSDETKWSARIATKDLGTGTHTDYLLDPDMLLMLIDILQL